MNGDQVKGILQKAGGHVEEAAGALVGDEGLKLAGKEDQIKGDARQAWGNVKDAGDALIDRAKVAKADAEVKAARAEAFDEEHKIEVVHQESPPPPKKDPQKEEAAKQEAQTGTDAQQQGVEQGQQ
jgi:uncharacterized protein YjbJ (UPF0337 family)